MKKSFAFFAAILISSFSFAQVTQQWAALFDSGPNNSEVPVAMVADASGNTYITGYTVNADIDIVTVKYDINGVQQWATTYSNPGVHGDAPKAIVLDASGNVYVTGSTYDGVTYDCVTIKYDNNGTEQWATVYNGAANGDDQGSAIAVDASGNVYVEGEEYNGGNIDYLTIKYDGAGAQQWATNYDGGISGNDSGYEIAVDGSGNVFVTGNSSVGPNQDFATIKYDNAGAAQWVMTYGNPSGGDEFVRGLIIEAGGDVIVSGESFDAVTGSDYVVMKYDNSGALLFTSSYSETPTSDELEYDMVVDAAGNIYMTGSTSTAGNTAYATVKFNSSGVQQWSAVYTGPTLSDFATAIAVDASGNVYVTGNTYDLVPGGDIGTIKYDNNGVQQWIQNYNGTANSSDSPLSIALDGSGNVFVGGLATNTVTGQDYVVIKYALSPLSTTQSQTDLTCNSVCDGTAAVVVSGGVAPYTYAWMPSGGSAATATNLCAANYTCTITDAIGGTTDAFFTLTQPTVLLATKTFNGVSCFGGNDGAAEVFPTGGTPGYTFSWAPFGGNASAASGLVNGTYTCTITDANGCSINKLFNITTPPPISVASSQTDVTCTGNADGSATVVAAGGTGTLTYSWAPSGGNAATESSLAPGSYTCTISDANGCNTPQTFDITEPTPITSVNSQTDVTCFGGNNGDATVSPSGGTGSYTYSWAPTGGTAATESSLIAGVYVCTITDANGCTASETITITEPPVLTAAKTFSGVSCFGGNDGAAAVFPTGGTPGYTYSWAPFGGNASSATGLVNGTYTCTITDANGCSINKLFNITSPPPISVVGSQTDVTCNGNANGSASVVAAGGVGTLTYSWAPSGGNLATESSLIPGSYTCTITDINGCSATQTFGITEPALITSTNMQTNVSCSGGNNGEAMVMPSGGTAPYTYSWAPSGGTAATESSLIAGVYVCTITDVNGCTDTETITLTEPAALTGTASQTDATCFGGNTGIATVNITGGTGAYSYAWTSGGNAATESSLAAGTYTCTITDANSCVLTKTFTITEPAAITATISQTDATCNGSATGTASVVASGGTPAYTYAWFPSGGNAATASSLAAGNYTCTITDANGCTGSETFTITEPAGITAATSQTDVTCFGGTNGTATVNPSGGTAPYSYAWAPSGGTGALATSLPAGIFTCTITDAIGCSTTQTVLVTEPVILSATTSQTNISCFGSTDGTATVVANGGTPAYTYAWTPSGGNAATASGLGTGTYTCTITDANGCSIAPTITITEPASISATTSQTNISCFNGSNGSATVNASGGTPAYAYAWMPSGGNAATATGLTTGNYTCTITDANGCSIAATFTITEPTALASTNSQTDNTCFGGTAGSATVTASGGTPAYTYAWMPTGGNAATASSLSAGSYTCTITDANGCTLDETFTITEPAAIITSNAAQDNVTCNGGNNGHAQVLASGGTGILSYDWTPGTPTGDGTNDVTGLTAGTWTVTVTDANSCSVTQTFNITEPLPLAVVNAQTTISCNGLTDGTATVAVSGGTPGYLYTWAPTGGNTATATSLAVGIYTCTIVDANGCSTNATFSITEPAILTSTTAQTNVSCNGGANGTATVTASGGTPAYSYAWTPSGGSAATATGLSAGTYTCTITDANGCTASAFFNITAPSAITATTAQTNVSCNSGSNGTASVVASGGTPAYTYAWAPSGGNAATATGLAFGNYTCTITDANSCTLTQTFDITQPPAITATPVQTNISCNGGANGTASVVVSGGTPGYTYAWIPSGGNAATASGLTSGNYTCTITDANACTLTQTFNITQPSAITATTAQTNITCNGSANGTASVVASGGTPAYTYAWTPSGGNAATATGLIPGTYTCTITDANGCVLTQTFNITEPAVLAATTSQTNVSCNGGSNGSASVVVSGGTPAYSYAWSPSGGNAATASGLASGNYTCTITDANACTLTKTFNVTQPPAITATATQTNISCNGGTNGSASVVVSGGTPGYTYAWVPTGGNAATATGLVSGNYTCTITDANACTLTQTFNITQPSVITATTAQTNVSCNGGSNGTASVVASGGTPAYTYAWIPTGGNAATATGLVLGNYTCTITDANGCALTKTFNITQPPVITVTTAQTNISCNGGTNGSASVVATGGTPGYTYAWIPTGGNAATASGLVSGNYTCTITDANGCTLTQTFNITQPSAITATTAQTNITCNGSANGTASVVVSDGTPAYTYAWTPSGGNAATATGLIPGAYSCTITDANGCTLTKTFNITQPAILATTSVITPVSCFGTNTGSATVVVTGGTTAYTYAWLPTGGNDAAANNLLAGLYTCTVTDANGCTTTQSVTITEPTALATSAVSSDITCNGNANGSAGVTASGGTPGYNYLWAPNGETTPAIAGLIAGGYTCTITDANGCTLQQAFTITEPALLTSTITSVPVSCQGGSNGIAHISVSGGTADYSFVWSPTGGTDSVATGLHPGTYVCNVTDANGCTLINSVFISEPSALIVVPSHTNAQCNGGANGTATVSVSGGNPAYTYSWTPFGGTAATATNLIAGTYTCLITDAGGCSISQTITIAQPASLTATSSQTNVSCNGGSNGSATIIVNGGSPFYSYNWLPTGGTGPIATGLAHGIYTCDVTDANGCTMSQSFDITEPPALSAVTSSANTNCGQNNGTAVIVANGGTMPYHYAWSPVGGTSDTATGIPSGTYTCVVTDAHGCSGSYTVVVNDTPAPTLALVSQTNILCNGNNTGNAVVLATGGVGTYTYLWSPIGGTTDSASALTAGSYTCTVTDSAGCTGTQTVTITEPILLTASSTSGAILCNGGSTTVTVAASGGVSPYIGEGTFTDTAGTYTYMITDANGCSTSTSITVTEPAPLSSSITATSILCNGDSATITVNAMGGTSPYTGTGTSVHSTGTYTFIITDTNGCSVTDSITIAEPTALSLSSSATSILCNGGNATVTVIATGGVSPYAGTGTFVEVAGAYNYIVTDSNGCTDSTAIVITEPTLLVSAVDSVSNPTGCSATDGMIYISVTGGTSAYSFLWTNTTTAEDLAGVGAGTYSCTITDANGCTDTLSASITDPLPPLVTVSIDTTLCVSNAPYTLTEGSPVGGTWSGNSISGNDFDPAAGVGAYVLTYSFTAANGCSASASDTILVDACIGIDENPTAAEWSVYPNPTFGEVILSTNSNKNENHLVEVYSSEGKLIFAENFAGDQQIKLNIMDQASGIYMVRISSASEISTVRVIRQ